MGEGRCFCVSHDLVAMLTVLQDAGWLVSVALSFSSSPTSSVPS